jgi:cell division protein FtsB
MLNLVADLPVNSQPITMNKLFGHIPSPLRNKYIIALSAFAVIMLFLDKNDFFTQQNRRQELRKLEQSKTYYTRQIEAERKELELLKRNPATLERYAREKYFMKKDNEELFIIPEKPTPDKN